MDAYFSGSWTMDAAQDLHQGAFAGTVFTQQRENFTFVQREVNSVEHSDTAERLADSPHFEQRGVILNRRHSDHEKSISECWKM